MTPSNWLGLQTLPQKSHHLTMNFPQSLPLLQLKLWHQLQLYFQLKVVSKIHFPRIPLPLSAFLKISRKLRWRGQTWSFSIFQGTISKRICSQSALLCTLWIFTSTTPNLRAILKRLEFAPIGWTIFGHVVATSKLWSRILAASFRQAFGAGRSCS